MPTYQDIQRAYTQSRKSFSTRQDIAFKIVKIFKESFIKQGEFPENVVLLYPSNQRRENSCKGFPASSATKFNNEKKCWEFSLLVDIRDQSFLEEILLGIRLLFELKITDCQAIINCELTPNQKLENTFPHEINDVSKLEINHFVDSILQAIYDRFSENYLSESSLGFKID